MFRRQNLPNAVYFILYFPKQGKMLRFRFKLEDPLADDQLTLQQAVFYNKLLHSNAELKDVNYFRISSTTIYTEHYTPLKRHQFEDRIKEIMDKRKLEDEKETMTNNIIVVNRGDIKNIVAKIELYRTRGNNKYAALSGQTFLEKMLRITPEKREIFVFGSNLAGEHLGGSASAAVSKHGARYFVGVGPSGNAYAIPTLDMAGGEKLPNLVIQAYVSQFKEYARENPHLTFNVVAIGCGIAGFSPEEIGPMFEGSPDNVKLPPEFQPKFLKEKRLREEIGMKVGQAIFNNFHSDSKTHQEAVVEAVWPYVVKP